MKVDQSHLETVIPAQGLYNSLIVQWMKIKIGKEKQIYFSFFFLDSFVTFGLLSPTVDDRFWSGSWFDILQI